MTDARTLQPEPVTLACADGQRLQGHFFATRGEAAAPAVLISPATGVRQQFQTSRPHIDTWFASGPAPRDEVCRGP